MTRTSKIAAASLGLALASAGNAQSTPAAPERVAVVVEVPRPAGLGDAAIRAEMEKLVPKYAQLPGLIRKYFTVTLDHFGGIYYWSSRASAEAWFNDTWKAGIVKVYGAPATLRYYGVPVAVDGQHP